MPPQNGCPCEVDFIGELELTLPENAILVETDKDYVQACSTLSKQLGARQTLKIWVRNRHHFSWLKDFSGQINLECLFEEKTITQILAERWNVILPDWLDDEMVLDQRLLDLEAAAQPRDSFINRLLVHFFGDGFRGEVLSDKNLLEVMIVFAATTSDIAFKRYPVLRSCLEAKCKKWVIDSSEKWVKSFCDRLPYNFHELWEALSFWSILHGYPGKLLDYVLPAKNAAWVTQIPPGAVAGLPLESTAREQALTQIEVFFNGMKPQVTTGEGFRKVLGCVSGRFAQEFKHISDLIRSNQFIVSVEDVQRVQDRFKTCPGVTASQLGLLTYCVMPARPSLLDAEKGWSAKEWIGWAVDEYVPYRTWQIFNNRYDEEIEQTVRRFSDWYIQEYECVHKDPELSLVHSLRDAGCSGDKKELSVVLLIDCLPLQFAGLLDDAFRNCGFSIHDRTYRFAPLPTTTIPNKAAVLGGEWDCCDKDYESVLKTRSERDWNGQKVIYASNLKALSELDLPDVCAVVALNFVDGDELLHEDVESKNTTHEEELHRLFNRVAEAVRHLCDRWSDENENFIVRVATDHGACRILDEEKRSFDSGLINKLFPNEKHRFSSVDAAKAGDVPENLWDLGYKFKQPFHSDGKVYFIPKGHNTVRLPAKGKGFLHGGATPEEVIVPTALYKAVKVAWKHPFARFLNLSLDRDTRRAKFYVQRIVSLEIELQNPNSSVARVIRAGILAPGADLKGCDTPSIEPGQTGVLRMNCYFKKSAVGEGDLVIEVAYEIAGESHTFTVPLECRFRSAVTTGFSLKDLS